MAYEWAKPGVKVVCVDSGKRYAYLEWGGEISKGSIYTIRDITRSQYTFGVGIRLVEVIRDLSGSDEFEQPFDIDRFRPLISQAQDIEMFLRLASPSPLERLDRLAEELDSLYND